MSLDLIKVVSQVGGMVARLKAGAEEKRQHLQYALEVASNGATDLDDLKRKIACSRTRMRSAPTSVKSIFDTCTGCGAVGSSWASIEGKL